MRRITITRHITVVQRRIPVVRPLPPRAKKPVTIRVGNVTKTVWI